MAFAQPGGSGGSSLPDQDMPFAQPGGSGSQPQQDALPGPSPEGSEKESPPHLLRSGNRFMRNKKPLKRRSDAEVIAERAGSFENAYSYLKDVGFLPYETPK